MNWGRRLRPWESTSILGCAKVGKVGKVGNVSKVVNSDHHDIMVVCS